MEYTEFILTTDRPHALAAEAVATAVCDGGLYVEDYAGLEEDVRQIAHVDLIEQELLDKPRDEIIIHLYTAAETAAAFSEDLHARLLAAGIEYTLHTQNVHDEDWENSWKQYYHPIEIGKRLAIAPSWEAYQNPQRVVLRLDPGMAFGNGTHETTALCLSVLDERVKGGERMLDIGCGSGILAVAALLLGAQSALGIDIDETAVRTAQENAQRNGVDSRFTAAAGDLAQQASGTYDIITANIVADAILRLAPAIPSLLAPGGVFIASGIIDAREAEVMQGLAGAGLHTQKMLRQNGWVAICATLPQAGAD